METFNPKKDQNVYCWICDHFQRLDQEKEPESCAGQCRYNSPGDVLWSSDGNWMQFWPLIEDSVGIFCGRFTPTLEKGLPDPPDPCTPELPDPPREFGWMPWNKKAPENVLCWTCDHFARLYEDLSTAPTGAACYGNCRRLPPGPYTYYQLNTSPLVQGELKGAHWSFSGRDLWCHRWERATHIVPPMPECDIVLEMRYSIGGSFSFDLGQKQKSKDGKDKAAKKK